MGGPHEISQPALGVSNHIFPHSHTSLSTHEVGRGVSGWIVHRVHILAVNFRGTQWVMDSGLKIEYIKFDGRIFSRNFSFNGRKKRPLKME